MKFGHKKDNKEENHKRIKIVTRENIQDFLHGIEESIKPLLNQSPDRLREPLLKESQLWFDQTINKGVSLDADSFRSGAVYGIYSYIKALSEKQTKKDSYVV